MFTTLLKTAVHVSINHVHTILVFIEILEY